MFSLVVVMSVLGIGLCYERFQCNFENENLKFIKNKDSNVWGTPTENIKPLEFQDKKTLDDFINKLDQGRRDFYKNNVYDDVDTYPTESDFKALPKEGTEDIKDKFIKEHVIDMETAQSTLGQLVKFFTGLKVNGTIDDHCYLAVILEVNGGTNNEILHKIGSEETWDNYFLEPKNSLVGIIKIKYIQIGYIIINLNDPEVHVPIVYENQNQELGKSEESHPNQDEESGKNQESLGSQNKESGENQTLRNQFYTFYPGYFKESITFDVYYTLIGKDNLFIRNDNVDTIDEETFTKVIYNRPLCSVVELQNKASISMRHRTILKYNEHDLTFHASVVTLLSNASTIERKVNKGKKFFITISFLYVYDAENLNNHNDKNSTQLTAKKEGNAEVGKDEAKTEKATNEKVLRNIYEGHYYTQNSTIQDKPVNYWRVVYKLWFDSFDDLCQDNEEYVVVKIANIILGMDLKAKLTALMESAEKASTDKAQTNGASTEEASTDTASTEEASTDTAQTNVTSTDKAQTIVASTGGAQTNVTPIEETLTEKAP